MLLKLSEWVLDFSKYKIAKKLGYILLILQAHENMMKRQRK